MISINNLHSNNTNAKAAGLTVLTCLLLIFIFLFIRWKHTVSIPPDHIDDGGVEVNFGNSDQGLGDAPPMVEGDPAPEAEESTPAPPASASQQEEEPTSKEIAENNDADATEIKTVKEPKKVEKKIEKAVPEKTAKKEENKPNPNTEKKPAATMPSVAKESKPETPKAVYKGGNGKGGNGADSYNGVSSQGIAGGRGDQGKMGGNPNSDSYTGTGKGTGGSGSGYGSSGVQVLSGLTGRNMFSFSFEDKFNENAKVSVDISINADGHVTSASINPRGTTTTNSNIRSIALKRARQLKFSKGTADSQNGTVSFNFRLKG